MEPTLPYDTLSVPSSQTAMPGKSTRVALEVTKGCLSKPPGPSPIEEVVLLADRGFVDVDLMRIPKKGGTALALAYLGQD